jgi:chorismate synthase
MCLRVRRAPDYLSSIRIPGRTVNAAGEAAVIETRGRLDPGFGIRAVLIADAMLALVLIDHALRVRARINRLAINKKDHGVAATCR